MEAPPVEAVLARLRAFRDPSPLVPSAPRDAALDDLIAALDAPPPVRSALHLWNDSLSRCHALAQDIPDSTGSYLHGLMHRREPDYENARYWFRRAGSHPVEAIMRTVPIMASAWDPFRMVDLCEKAAGDPVLEKALREVQAREIDLLAAFCLRT